MDCVGDMISNTGYFHHNPDLQMATQVDTLSSAIALKKGHSVLWYEIESILGRGGFGITYLAKDTNLNRWVAIKEFLPNGYAHREADSTIRPLTNEHGDIYKWGLDSFIKEAQTLAKFRHPNIIHVLSVFEANNSAYMVMEYVQGEDLATRFNARQGSISQNELERIFVPIMDGLEKVHEAGFIHRDIKPANIFIRQDKTPVLLDFGAARQTLQQQSGEMTVLVSRGYTPPEQYGASFGEQGPWTDIYALASCLYDGITGEKPADALQRVGSYHMGKEDPVKTLQSLKPQGYSLDFLKAIDLGLSIPIEDRPQTLSEWLNHFVTADEKTVLVSQFTPVLTTTHSLHRPAETVPKPLSGDQSSQVGTKKTSSVVLWSGIGFAVLAALTGSWFLFKPAKEQIEVNTTALVQDIDKVTSAPAITETVTEQDVLVISESYLRSLPPPESTFTFDDLDQQSILIARQLHQAGAMHREALALYPEAEDAKKGLAKVLTGFKTLLSQPWVENNEFTRNRIIELGGEIFPGEPQLFAIDSHDTPFDQSRLVDEVLERIARNEIAQPVGNSAIDVLAYIQDKALVEELKARSEFADLIDNLKISANDAILNGNPELAAEIVRSALAISPENAEFLLLKKHLSGGP